MTKTIKGYTTKITDVRAIVNAANSNLLGGGGVDSAIHRAADKELLFRCGLLGGCKTGQAKVTKRYNLRCDYVIHIVGPIWSGGGKNETEFLGQCYYNSIRVALKNGIRRVTFLSISVGIYCFPVEQAAEIVIRTVNSFLDKNGQAFELAEWILLNDCTKQTYDKTVEKSHQRI